MPIIRLLFNTKFQLTIIILLTIGVYTNTFGNQLVWDDKTFAEWQQTASFANLPYFLKGNLPGPHQGDYRLFKGIILTFDKVVFANSLFVFHLQAILIHLSATLLVYFLTKEIFKQFYANRNESFDKLRTSQANDRRMSETVPFLTALLFGVHPVHVEAITFITSSTDILGISFLLAAFYFYLRATSQDRAKGRLLLISGVLAFLAFATYEVALVLPLLLVLYDFCLSHEFKKRLRFHLFYLAIIVFYAILRFGVLKLSEENSYLAGSFYLTALAMVKVIAKYIDLTIF